MKKILVFVLVFLFVFLAACSGSPNSVSSIPAVSSQTESKPSSTVTSVPTRSEPETSSVPESTSSLSELPPEEYWRPGRGYFYQEYLSNPVQADLDLLKNEVICQISNSVNRTYLLTESGRLFASGASEFHSFAQESYMPIFGLVEIDLPESIKMIHAGEYCCVAVGESNTIYLWGHFTSRVYDQIELYYDQSSPLISVPFEKEVKDVKCEGTRVVILTEQGEVYAFGDSYLPWGGITFDQTYDGYEWSEENFLIPQKIQVPEKVVQISSTAVSMFLLGESGTCYAGYYAGYGEYAIRFPSKDCASNPKLRVLDFSQPIVSIGTADSSLFVLTKNGEVYTAGNNSTLHLGIGLKKDSNNHESNFSNGPTWILKEFEKVPLPEKVIQLGNCADQIGLFLTESGKIYATGYNYKDWLLTGREIPPDSEYNEERLTEPVLMQIPDAVEEFSGTGPATFYRRADGKVFFVGLATYGNGLAVDLPDKLDNVFVQRTPVEIPLNFSENCRFN